MLVSLEVARVACLCRRKLLLDAHDRMDRQAPDEDDVKCGEGLRNSAKVCSGVAGAEESHGWVRPSQESQYNVLRLLGDNVP